MRSAGSALLDSASSASAIAKRAMGREEIRQAFSDINKSCSAMRFDDVLRRIRDLRAALARESDVNPRDLGWADYYEVKSLYSLGRPKRAYKKLQSLREREWSLPRPSLAFLYSVAAELAAELGDVHAVALWGLNSAAIHGDDSHAAGLAARTACSLLERLEREDLSIELAYCLVDLGSTRRIPSLILDGYEHLFLAAHRRGSQRARTLLVSGIPLIATCTEFSGYATRANALVGKIERQPWYPGKAGDDVLHVLLRGAREGNEGLVRAGLERTTDFLGCDSEGNTALALACMHGHGTIAAILVDAGSPIAAPNGRGRTARDHAASAGHQDIVELLDRMS